jgi:hypothetical protein
MAGAAGRLAVGLAAAATLLACEDFRVPEEERGPVPQFAVWPGLQAVTLVALSHRVRPAFDAPFTGDELSQGSVVDVLEGPVDAVWYRVRHGDQVGWSHGGFLQTLEPAPPAAALPAVVVGANVASSEPRIGDGELAPIDGGTAADIVGGPTLFGAGTPEWIRVRVDGDDAWSLAEGVLPALDELAPAPPPPVSASREGRARVTGHPLVFLRDRPWGALVAFIPPMVTVDVLGGPSEDGWVAVRYFPIGDGFHQGWVWGDFLGPVEGAHRAVPEPGDNPNHLPWTAGRARYVIQGNWGTFSHHPGTNDQWAWDFSPYVDGSSEIDDRVLAAHDGVVRAAQYSHPTHGAIANFVVLAKGDGTESLYLHLAQIADPEDQPVRPGQAVQRGDLLGRMGDSGFSAGVHLHYHVQRSPPPGAGVTIGPSIPSSFWDGGTPVAPVQGTYVVAGSP